MPPANRAVMIARLSLSLAGLIAAIAAATAPHALGDSPFGLWSDCCTSAPIPGD